MDPRGVLVYADLSCHKNANPPLKWGTDPQIFVTTKRHAKRIEGPKNATPRGNRGRRTWKEEEEDKEQEVYIKEAASAGWTNATRLGPSPSLAVAILGARA